MSAICGNCGGELDADGQCADCEVDRLRVALADARDHLRAAYLVTQSEKFLDAADRASAALSDEDRP